jgi:hypothetical protein
MRDFYFHQIREFSSTCIFGKNSNYKDDFILEFFTSLNVTKEIPISKRNEQDVQKIKDFNMWDKYMSQKLINESIMILDKTSFMLHGDTWLFRTIMCGSRHHSLNVYILIEDLNDIKPHIIDNLDYILVIPNQSKSIKEQLNKKFDAFKNYPNLLYLTSDNK